MKVTRQELETINYNPIDLLVWLCLQDRAAAGLVQASTGTLCAETHLSHVTIIHSLRRLQDAGLVTKVKDGEKGAPAIYRLHRLHRGGK